MIMKWAEAGFITLTPGDVIDYDFIEQDILNRHAGTGEDDRTPGYDGPVYDIQAIGSDPWNATATNGALDRGRFRRDQRAPGIRIDVGGR